MLRRFFTLVAVLPSIAVAGGCAYRRACVRQPEPEPPAASAAYVKFLGVSGFLIRLGTDAILTAPLYTNPTMGEIALQQVHPDHRLIDALLPRRMSDVEVILSGHSHYDHLMDVPYVALHHTPRALIYGNNEMPKLLDSLAGESGPFKNRLVSLEGIARKTEALRCLDDCPDAISYRQVGNVRIWPIISEHSPQFKIKIPFVGRLPDAHLWRGTLLEAPTRVPETVSGWVEGTTLAYLIDFMDGERIAFRVYYQDSGARDPYGFPPRCLLRQRRVDLALLCAGGSDFAKAHPTAIVKALEPRYVIAGHWEDFLNPRTLPLPTWAGASDQRRCPTYAPPPERIDAIPFTNPRSFAKRLKKALPSDGAYSMPCPDAWSYFGRDGDHWTLQSWSEPWTRR